MNMSTRCVRWCGRLMIVLLFLVIFVFFLLSQFTLSATKVRLIQGSLIQRNLDRLPTAIGTSLNNWFSKNIFRIKWENLHCKQHNGTLTEDELSFYMKPLVKQLRVRDGQALFDGNTGCLELLRYLHSEFPNLAVGGYDEDDDAVDYARRYFNDSIAFVKKTSEISRRRYDYVVKLGGLQTKRADRQCSEVKILLGSLKPGGTLYLGRNLERNCDNRACAVCLSEQESVGFTILEKCFWSKVCLGDQDDIFDIHYVPENQFYQPLNRFEDCRSGVFIRKKATVTSVMMTEFLRKRSIDDAWRIYHCSNRTETNLA